jgi:8-oxo-dGTP pyrophosphatase MutT (NUDIX family)
MTRRSWPERLTSGLEVLLQAAAACGQGRLCRPGGIPTGLTRVPECKWQVKQVISRLKRKAFWLISRTAIALYARLPVFGRLRGAVAVIRRGDQFLAIDRADGLGLSFPGGLAHVWEKDEATMRREVQEETGLTVREQALVLCYDHDWPYPHRTSVFDVRASGDARGSWEGTPVWVELPELSRRVVRNQREIVARIAADGKNKGRDPIEPRP